MHPCWIQETVATHLMISVRSSLINGYDEEGTAKDKTPKHKTALGERKWHMFTQQLH